MPPAYVYRGGLRVVPRNMGRKIWLKISRDDPSVTLTQVAEKIEDIQRRHPDLEVFFDGDEFAICSVPRRG